MTRTVERDPGRGAFDDDLGDAEMRDPHQGDRRTRGDDASGRCRCGGELGTELVVQAILGAMLFESAEEEDLEDEPQAHDRHDEE